MRDANAAVGSIREESSLRREADADRLAWLVDQRDLASLREALDQGALVEAASRQSDGVTPLMRACANLWAQGVELLLERGASHLAQDANGDRPLAFCVPALPSQQGPGEPDALAAACCQALLKAGADPDHSGRDPGQGSLPGDAAPIRRAVRAGCPLTLRALADGGARLAPDLPLLAAQKGKAAMLEALLLRGAPPDLLDREGLSCAHHAAQRARPDMLASLARAGADLGLPSGEPPGSTPLELAQSAVLEPPNTPAHAERRRVCVEFLASWAEARDLRSELPAPQAAAGRRLAL